MESLPSGQGTRFFVHFVKDKLFPGWVTGTDVAADEHITGDDVDLLCLDWAEKHQIPLVRLEGHGQNGFDPMKLIPTQGAARGIDVVSPEQFLQRAGFDVAPAIQRFIADWDRHAADYVKENPSAARTLTEIARPFYQRLVMNDWTP